MEKKTTITLTNNTYKKLRLKKVEWANYLDTSISLDKLLDMLCDMTDSIEALKDYIKAKEEEASNEEH